MSDPAIEAARDIANNSLDAMRRAIVDAPPELLNWRPAGEDTNPIAVIAVHAITSTRWWLSVAITGKRLSAIVQPSSERRSRAPRSCFRSSIP